VSVEGRGFVSSGEVPEFMVCIYTFAHFCGIVLLLIVLKYGCNTYWSVAMVGCGVLRV
jgi:hypothetical protein